MNSPESCLMFEETKNTGNDYFPPFQPPYHHPLMDGHTHNQPRPGIYVDGVCSYYLNEKEGVSYPELHYQYQEACEEKPSSNKERKRKQASSPSAASGQNCHPSSLSPLVEKNFLGARVLNGQLLLKQASSESMVSGMTDNAGTSSSFSWDFDCDEEKLEVQKLIISDYNSSISFQGVKGIGVSDDNIALGEIEHSEDDEETTEIELIEVKSNGVLLAEREIQEREEGSFLDEKGEFVGGIVVDPVSSGEFLEMLHPAARRTLLAQHHSFCGEMKKPENRSVSLLSMNYAESESTNSTIAASVPMLVIAAAGAGVPVMVGALGNASDQAENSGRCLTLPGGRTLALGKATSSSSSVNGNKIPISNNGKRKGISNDDNLSVMAVTAASSSVASICSSVSGNFEAVGGSTTSNGAVPFSPNYTASGHRSKFFNEPWGLRSSVYNKFILHFQNVYNTHNVQALMSSVLYRCCLPSMERVLNLWVHFSEPDRMKLVGSRTVQGHEKFLSGYQHVFEKLPDCVMVYQETTVHQLPNDRGVMSITPYSYFFTCILPPAVGTTKPRVAEIECFTQHVNYYDVNDRIVKEVHHITINSCSDPTISQMELIRYVGLSS